MSLKFMCLFFANSLAACARNTATTAAEQQRANISPDGAVDQVSRADLLSGTPFSFQRERASTFSPNHTFRVDEFGHGIFSVQDGYVHKSEKHAVSDELAFTMPSDELRDLRELLAAADFFARRGRCGRSIDEIDDAAMFKYSVTVGVNTKKVFCYAETDWLKPIERFLEPRLSEIERQWQQRHSAVRH
jgi:hypothetical protein